LIRAILFDLDGTLIDSRRDLADAVNVALGAVGLPHRSLEEITAFIGEGSRRLVEKAIAPRGDLLAAAHAAWESAYEGCLLRHTVFYPGMCELVEKVSSRLEGRVAVHTNKPGDMARQIIEGLGALPFFARVLGSGDGAARKPAPEGARLLLDQLGVAAPEAVYVGDSAIDLETAAAAGIPFLGCGWGYEKEAVLSNRGAKVAAEVRELTSWLEGLTA
jgi:phosphoglycolate phosphatase